MADKQDDRLKGYIVIALTASTGKKYEDCKVIAQGDVFPAIYSQVFGPAQHCVSRFRATRARWP